MKKTGGDQKKKEQASTQAYLPISEIKESVVVMNDNSLRSVLIVSSVNFALKSEDEKNAIVTSYQDFLNSLEFPIQIIAHSRKLDLSEYLGSINALAENQQNPLLKVQTKEYSAFIQKLLEVSNIMEKRFYVVVPYFPAGINVDNKIPILSGAKKNNQVVGSFEDHKKKLLGRVNLIIQSLSSVGLRCATLSTEDLLELYYLSYNPDAARSSSKVRNTTGLAEKVVTMGQNPKGGPDVAL